MLQKSMEQLFRERRPDCIVSDMFYPWTADVASQLGIPRLVFHASSFFSHCAADSIRRYVQSDTQTFVMPGLPDKIEMTRLQLPDWVRARIEYSHLMDQIIDSGKRSYGVVVNSFYERDTTDKAERGNKAFFDGVRNCLSWLDSKEPNSVLYVSFGSLTKFLTAQVLEIASGLQASGHPFIWVVRMAESSKEEDDIGGLPEGFEERMMEGNKCLIIRDWAPQLLILDHPAIGGLETHCGWNSILEGVTAGLPMITWPLFAEQFYNEKLVTQVLKIGVGVGVEAWASSPEQQAKVLVKREKIEKAVTMLMSNGEEAEEMRRRARELGESAKRAVEEGGSSQANLSALIKELESTKNGTQNQCHGKPNHAEG
ncbi:hypothetical protein HHK36_009880 [Tetracentron sinense]|uniref:Uncharacterized protein n=1 Tax=Tetracentron sinense TaxID=13715 RepID=A0A834ZFZ7_TETSI|nr:hypothetical protein HHK36_009880 [Tetracentron sinense]